MRLKDRIRLAWKVLRHKEVLENTVILECKYLEYMEMLQGIDKSVVEQFIDKHGGEDIEKFLRMRPIWSSIMTLIRIQERLGADREAYASFWSDFCLFSDALGVAIANRIVKNKSIEKK